MYMPYILHHWTVKIIQVIQASDAALIQVIARADVYDNAFGYTVLVCFLIFMIQR